MDEDDTVVVPKESLPEPTISITALKKTVKRPMSDKQKENVEKLVQANKLRWESNREEKQKQKSESLASVRQEEEKLIEGGTHIRMKVREKIQKPRKPVQKQQKQFTDTEDTTETEADTEDEVPEPRHIARQARKQMKTIQKMDEVIQQAVNPYMTKLLGRWK